MCTSCLQSKYHKAKWCRICLLFLALISATYVTLSGIGAESFDFIQFMPKMYMFEKRLHRNRISLNILRSIHWIAKHLLNFMYEDVLRCLLCCKWNNGKQWNANTLSSASNQWSLLSKFRQESTIEMILFKCIVHNSIAYYRIKWQTNMYSKYP